MKMKSARIEMPAQEAIIAAGRALLARHPYKGNRLADVAFGDEKVFIYPIWREIHQYNSISLESFKSLLVELHRAGKLSLSRADLVEAMDPTVVKKSEIRRGGSEWHFVRIR